MVFLTLKKNEESLLFMESSVSIQVDELIPKLVHLHNERLRIERLCRACEDLCEYGIWKPESEHGYTDEQLAALSVGEKAEKKPPKQTILKNGQTYLLNPDPTGRRCGEAPTEEMALIIQKTLSEARSCISKENVKSRICLTEEKLTECIDNIRGAVSIAFPMGLPVYEPVQEILDDKEDLTGTSESKLLHDPSTASLWWAGKEIGRGKKLLDFVGKNDKTTIIVKLQKRGQGPPSREPPLDAEGQKQMMAYWYKKQEEEKKLLECDDDSYINSSWANPKGLKQSFHGVGNIRFAGLK